MILTAALAFLQISLASPLEVKNHPVPVDSGVLYEISAAPRAGEVPNHFQLMTWNTHKGSDKAKWAADLHDLLPDLDFVLLQEGMRDKFMPAVLSTEQRFGFTMAQSFFYGETQVSTGVITGSAVAPLYSMFRRSHGREPFWNTPKIALATSYTLKNGRSLLVVNVHGINFVMNSVFENQIDDLVAAIRPFDGDIVIAGDFNTWNGGRTAYLQKAFSELGISELAVEGVQGRQLDRVFQRGCPASRAWSLEKIMTSDHKPVRADLTCQ